MLPRRTSGFTLIELMIVVVIIAVLMTYAVPGITRTIADRRAAAAISEIVRIGRRARTAADSKLPAHLLVLSPGAGALGNGTVRLLRGQTTRCQLQNWQAAMAMCPPAPRAANVIDQCAEELDLNLPDWSGNPFNVRLRSLPPGPVPGNLDPVLLAPEANVFSVCFENSGVTYWSVSDPAAGAMVFSELNVNQAAGGGFMFMTGLVADGVVHGVPRLFSVPLGSSPRRVR